MHEVTDIEHRCRFLTPAAFGVHHRLQQRVEEFFERHLGHSTFFLYEYFLGKPYTHWDLAIYKKDEQEALSDQRQPLTVPFMTRIIYKSGFLPALNRDNVQTIATVQDIKAVPITPHNLNQYWSDADNMVIRLRQSLILSLILEAWLNKDIESLAEKEEDVGRENRQFSTGTRLHSWKNGTFAIIGGYDRVFIAETYPASIIKKMRMKNPDWTPDIALSWLREYSLVLQPWVRSNDQHQFGLVCLSISSKAIFWGQCLLLFPLHDDEITAIPPGADRRPKWLLQLALLMRKEIDLTYTPMLTLLENYLYEREFKTLLRTDRSILKYDALRSRFPYRGLNYSWIDGNREFLKHMGAGFPDPFDEQLLTTTLPKYSPAPDATPIRQVFLRLLDCCAARSLREGTFNPWTRSLNKLERTLAEVWADRFATFQEDPEAVVDSLVFDKYLIASPAMVQLTLQAMSFAQPSESKKKPQYRKKRAIKTALVVGAPGSGKDSMARLIHLFSPGYRFRPITVFNMAMFRPKDLAVPLLLGVETRYQTKSMQDISLFTFEGLLYSALHHEKPDRKQDETEESMAGIAHTFIFDELNSLDIDTQGALLRFLENCELQALGGLDCEPRSLDLLIIAIINEDPDLITKKRTMERALRDKDFFGGILGEVIYELVRMQRRLRDDLYFRLIRGGQLNIPGLMERSEDIPILFHFLVDRYLEAFMPNQPSQRVKIELPVYETLMDPAFTWQGNIRELETITARIVRNALDDFELQRPRGDFVIRRGHVLSAIDSKSPIAVPGQRF